MSINIVLFQPDIPQNTGSFIRLCACMGVKLHIIEPCGFPLDEKKLARVAMDYTEHLEIIRHTSWNAFLDLKQGSPEMRLILLTTKASLPYTSFSFSPNDYLLFGRESSGVPNEVHDAAYARITIPMQGNARSLNVAMCASMVVGEAMRQLIIRGK